MYRPVVLLAQTAAVTPTVTSSVSVVIPTVGRPSLGRAVESVLRQSQPVSEIIVVADTERQVDLPSDERITLLRNDSPGGPAPCRQRGIDAARGSVIALLDDDDEWYPEKLQRQLAVVSSGGDPWWVVSSRIAVLGPGDRRRIWPRRLVQPRQSIADYLFRFRGLRSGGAVLQTSTLCFPSELARAVRWDLHTDAIHDEPSWLITVQRTIPGLRVIQLPDVLSIYNVSGHSVSRDASDRTDDYIAWGLDYLEAESPRILGDYLCTSPVSAAVSAGSVGGVRRSVQAAVRYGRPGLPAFNYAAMSAARIMLGRLSR